MDINDAGVELIKEFEGCRLKAYRDSVGVLTIGYGDTSDVYDGLEITQNEAEQRLRTRLTAFCHEVEQLLAVSVTDNQFAALVCFAYNLGSHALAGSTLLKLLNQGNIQGAADQFLRWDKAGGRVLEGLLRRRTAERSLFLA